MSLALTFDPGAMLVSGCGRVGAGVVRILAQAGVPVVFTYNRDSARADELVKAVEAAGDAQIGRGAGDPILDRGAVEVEHHGHHHRVRRAVMRVVDRADRMAERMDRPQPLLERDRAHRGRAHHVGAGLEVIGADIDAYQDKVQVVADAGIFDATALRLEKLAHRIEA